MVLELALHIAVISKSYNSKREQRVKETQKTGGKISTFNSIMQSPKPTDKVQDSFYLAIVRWHYGGRKYLFCKVGNISSV